MRLVGSAGVATSGDYERFFLEDGVRFHHILDGTTGRPARGVAAVTVVPANAFLAGRLSTAAFLLGMREGLALIEGIGGVEGCLIAEDGELAASTGMSRISDLPGSLYAAYPAV